jgi:hypothetical protein
LHIFPSSDVFVRFRTDFFVPALFPAQFPVLFLGYSCCQTNIIYANPESAMPGEVSPGDEDVILNHGISI